MKIEVTFTPAEFALLPQRDLSATACVVFDVLRATSTMITALARGAEFIQPVTSVAEALRCRAEDPDVLLAGERNGLRITAAISGGVDFDLGNSPREYTSAVVRGRRIVTTTTNGTRALVACRNARHVLAGGFLNLRHTAQQVRRCNSAGVILVCSGTGEEAAFEDALGAGALCDHLATLDPAIELTASAREARAMFLPHAEDLEGAMQASTNAVRLLAIPELRDDVAFCLTPDLFPITAAADAAGRVRRVST
jgi:2-phosphosulfolactate phosphatase